MSEDHEPAQNAHSTAYATHDPEYHKDGTKRRRLRMKSRPDSPRYHTSTHSYDETSDTTKEHKRHRHSKPHPRKDGYPRRHSDNTQPDEPAANKDPDAAFRESLFDAMADDEGADYWENVYGQPIHGYPKEKVGRQGELEEMSDEEYASYVRGRMWEKTHEAVLEEKARREEANRRRKEWRAKEAQVRKESAVFDRKVEESLRRGEERKKRKSWKDAWSRYHETWNRIYEKSNHGTKRVNVPLPWPVKTGKRGDVNRQEVETFMRNGLGHSEEEGSKDYSTLLKVERVRWHPDKVQQRFGSQKLGEDDIVAVTAAFQIIDSLWNQSKT